ncbi:hypothetical protein AciX9_1447 [Granulicella tundricola MP5ACTX9]|uniref:Uncharacterized protein n=1 Tax=Granulicella tundricola (strain ATCC BAA-1859 / DSM 23138 / MP5ACTX9) TaxID=1198114 RepID=E8WWB7_GRATM|nr:hypothetical protein AciX9_1447 [Granulicella tundricola MP5ACTX9]
MLLLHIDQQQRRTAGRGLCTRWNYEPARVPLPKQSVCKPAQLEVNMKTLISSKINTCGLGSQESSTLLLIEPRWPKVSRVSQQLEGSRFSVTVAHDAKDIYLMSGSIRIPCAVLSDELGAVALQASAEAVRWQWPRTSILILGTPGALEDHLYDDIVAHASGANVLIKRAESINEPAIDRRFDKRRESVLS